MIQIFQNKSLDKDRMNTIENWFRDKITLILKSNNYDKKKRLNKILDSYGIDLYNDIILAKFDKLLEKKEFIEKNINYSEICYKKDKSKKRKIAKMFFCKCYEKFRKEYGAELCQQLQISVCPYCNRNFINSYIIDDDIKTSAEFDHFFSKSKYPIFAISLYNLIPCCHDCNHTKGKEEFNISPYDKKYTTNNSLTFSFKPIENDEIKITIKPLIDKKNDDIKKLNLESKYQIHSQYVKEIIAKIHNYTPAYFNQPILRELNITDEELFIGNYLSEENYYKRPLSKLTHDINEEIKNYMKKE